MEFANDDTLALDYITDPECHVKLLHSLKLRLLGNLEFFNLREKILQGPEFRDRTIRIIYFRVNITIDFAQQSPDVTSIDATYRTN
jgi:hypothetical protein